MQMKNIIHVYSQRLHIYPIVLFITKEKIRIMDVAKIHAMEQWKAHKLKTLSHLPALKLRIRLNRTSPNRKQTFSKYYYTSVKFSI